MKVLVTGGGGFLGGEIVRQLKEAGHEVASFSRQHHKYLDTLAVTQLTGDLTSGGEALSSAVNGCDAVIHCASLASSWGSWDTFYRINVEGTMRVLEACQKAGVKALVYTSTPSVVFNGQDMEGADESAPYPKNYEANYPATKAMAEQLILKSNSPTLRTIALRPHLIWGPRDTSLTRRIIEQGAAGKLRRIGEKSKLVDTTYISDAAYAHILAMEKLLSTPEEAQKVAGKPYFITGDSPVPTWEIMDKILAAAALPPVKKTISKKAALIAAAMTESYWKVSSKGQEPTLTRWVVNELSTAHWFNISAAKRDLGYEPKVSVEKGLLLLSEWIKNGGQKEFLADKN